MKINPDQVLKQISKNLSHLYLVCGDEYLLVQETIDAIRAYAAKQGFTERLRFSVDASFNWATVQQATQNFSLFSDKQLVELHLTSQKLNDAGKRFLSDYALQPVADKLLLIITHKLEAGVQNTSWYKAVEKNGTVITAWPLQPAQFSYWIQQRLQQNKINADAQVIKLIAEFTQGNLLAAKQEIEKLALIYPDEKITAKHVINSSSDNARFDVFDLVDYVLQGNYKYIARSMSGLKAAGVESTFILWALMRELRHLIHLGYAIKAGQLLANLLTQQHIFEKRKPWIARVLKQNSLQKLEHYLQFAAQIDSMIKGATRGDVWQEMLALALLMAGAQLGIENLK